MNIKLSIDEIRVIYDVLGAAKSPSSGWSSLWELFQKFGSHLEAYKAAKEDLASKYNEVATKEVELLQAYEAAKNTRLDIQAKIREYDNE